MLLRRITEHVGHQNWFAVWIDFAIVVVGVFIGIQVSNWNDTQSERAQTQRMLSELMIDLTEMRKTVAEDRIFYFERASAVDTIISSFEGREVTDRDELRALAFNILTFHTLPSPPPALGEILVAGRLDLLGTVAIRDALLQFETDADSNSRTVEEINKVFWRVGAVIEPYMSFKRTPNLDGEAFQGSRADFDIDLDALEASARARQELKSLYAFHVNMQSKAESLLESIDAVLATTPDFADK